MNIYQLLGARLKELRKKQGLSQTELGQKLGFNKSYIAKIELAISCPPLDKVIKLANALNFSLKDLQDAVK